MFKRENAGGSEEIKEAEKILKVVIGPFPVFMCYLKAQKFSVTINNVSIFLNKVDQLLLSNCL